MNAWDHSSIEELLSGYFRSFTTGRITIRRLFVQGRIRKDLNTPQKMAVCKWLTEIENSKYIDV